MSRVLASTSPGKNVYQQVMISSLGFSHEATAAAAAAKSLQSCPTLCDPIDGSPTGFSVPGILQARILECIAISFSIPHATKVELPSRENKNDTEATF